MLIKIFSAPILLTFLVAIFHSITIVQTENAQTTTPQLHSDECLSTSSANSSSTELGSSCSVNETGVYKRPCDRRCWDTVSVCELENKGEYEKSGQVFCACKEGFVRMRTHKDMTKFANASIDEQESAIEKEQKEHPPPCIAVNDCPPPDSGCCENSDLSPVFCTQNFEPTCSKPTSEPGLLSCSPEIKCICREGLVRLYSNGTGPCVELSQCPDNSCPIEEQWSECDPSENEPTCGSAMSGESKSPFYTDSTTGQTFYLGTTTLTTTGSTGSKPVCRQPGGCTCLQGLVRGPLGHCYNVSSCPVCPANQTFVRCPDCIPVCGQSRPVCNLPACAWPYPNGVCQCSLGYLYGTDGQCIKESDCHSCPPNEEYKKCAQLVSDPDPTCEEWLQKHVINTTPRPPPPTRTMKRTQIGTESSTDATKTSTEKSTTKSSYPSYSTPPSGSVNTTKVSSPCSDGPNGLGICSCKDGYYKAPNGTCVRPADCPLCPRNETQMSCTPCEWYCSDPDKLVCRNGDSALSSGNSVLSQIVTSTVTKLVTVFTTTTTRKPPQTGKTTPGAGGDNKKPFCQCSPGYFRIADAEPCVLHQDCPPDTIPKCNTPNETLSEFIPCEQTCGQAPPTACKGIRPAFNKTICVCAEGYARNTSDPSAPCILLGDCPVKVSECGPNQVLSNDCMSCQASCEYPNDQLCIPTGNPCNTTRACQCAPGYVRNGTKDGPCIEPNKCPKLPEAEQCSMNETRSTCPPCDRRCGQSIGSCATTPCPKNGCKCKPGFVRGTGQDAPCINETSDCVCRPDCSPSMQCTFGRNGPFCQPIPNAPSPSNNLDSGGGALPPDMGGLGGTTSPSAPAGNPANNVSETSGGEGGPPAPPPSPKPVPNIASLQANPPGASDLPLPPDLTK